VIQREHIPALATSDRDLIECRVCACIHHLISPGPPLKAGDLDSSGMLAGKHQPMGLRRADEASEPPY